MFAVRQILGRGPALGRVMAFVLVLLLIGGCGQKGPLYLPDPTPAEAPRAR